MLFDTKAPEQSFNPEKNYSNNPWLGVLGYNPDGTRNTWGDINSWIPGVNIGANLGAQGITKGTDSEANVQGDMKNRIDKLMLEASIAATVATSGATLPTIAGTGSQVIGDATAVANTGADVGNAIGGGAAAGATDAIKDTTNPYLQNLGKQGVQMVQNAGKQALTNITTPQAKNPYLPKNSVDLTNYNNY